MVDLKGRGEKSRNKGGSFFQTFFLKTYSTPSYLGRFFFPI